MLLDNMPHENANHVYSMHIEGDIVVSIKHVAERGKNVAEMVTCLTETVLHPIICMLETWFVY